MRILLISLVGFKRWISIVLSFVPSLLSLAQTPELFVHSTSVDTLHFKVNNKTYMEIPPWTIEGGWHTYFQSSLFTRSVSSRDNLSHPKDKFIDFSNDFGYNLSVHPSIWKNKYITGNSTLNAPWRKNYNGIFSAHNLKNEKLGEYILAFSHGEQKNEVVWQDGKYIPYQNQIIALPIQLKDPETYSGFQSSGLYYEHWESYYGFININWVKRSGDNGWGHQRLHDLGPALWPSNGLIDSLGNKTSWGLRHPSSIIANDYIYIYYMDTSSSLEIGRQSGFKVARVHTDSTLIPYAYQCYYNGKWSQSLPKDFQKENLLSFKSAKGGKSSKITETFNGVRFSVAKVKGEDFYIAVEQNMDEGFSKVILRTSTNLIDWSDPIMTLHNSQLDSYDFSYPIFLDKSGWSNTEIDLDDFFVLGQTDLNKTIRIRIRLSKNSDFTSIKPNAFDLINNYSSEVINSIFPVPTNDYLTIHYQTNTHQEIEIRDLYGALIWKGTLTPFETNFILNTTSFRNGVYYIITRLESRSESIAFNVIR